MAYQAYDQVMAKKPKGPFSKTLPVNLPNFTEESSAMTRIRTDPETFNPYGLEWEYRMFTEPLQTFVIEESNAAKPKKGNKALKRKGLALNPGSIKEKIPKTSNAEEQGSTAEEFHEQSIVVKHTSHQGQIINGTNQCFSSNSSFEWKSNPPIPLNFQARQSTSQSTIHEWSKTIEVKTEPKDFVNVDRDLQVQFEKSNTKEEQSSCDPCDISNLLDNNLNEIMEKMAVRLRSHKSLTELVDKLIENNAKMTEENKGLAEESKRLTIENTKLTDSLKSKDEEIEELKSKLEESNAEKLSLKKKASEIAQVHEKISSEYAVLKREYKEVYSKMVSVQQENAEKRSKVLKIFRKNK